MATNIDIHTDINTDVDDHLEECLQKALDNENNSSVMNLNSKKIKALKMIIYKNYNYLETN